MVFRVLGPLEVERDGRPVPGLRPRARAVLAALLVDAGSTVPVDVLVDRAWGDRSIGSETATLHATISKLRRVLEPDVQGGAWQVLVTRAPGYRLAVSPDDVDATRAGARLRAARELARSRPDEARAAVADALALWRGPAYADVDEPFAAIERERLEDLRLGAHELAAALDLDLGRHDGLVEHLQTLVARAPLREGLRGQLMTALFRSGRQAEALQVYEQGRLLLADELGIDPGPDLQQLHARVLRQDPDLAPRAPRAPAPPPAAPPASVAPPTVTGRRLPVPLTSFVGRETELSRVAAAVAEHRLVTLAGPGGAGKTRLAVEAARHRLPEGLGVAMVELAGITDPRLVAGHVASTLGISLSGGDPTGALCSALEDRALLLLLDNCEHLLDPVAELTGTLLGCCPDLRVLATSRQPLGVPGEAIVPCGPMPADQTDSDAVRLFLDRARLAAPQLADPSDDDLAVVRRVCAELDGLPLAVELAAACLTTLPLSEVAERVGDRFTLLAGGRRTAPPHQRTLAATVQWSVDLLTPAELAVFRAVSVLPGGFTPDAVEAVAGPDVDGGTLEPLRALAAASLIELDHGRSRYRMLETLRQYADSALDADGRHRLRDRQAAFVAGLVERLEPTLRRRDGAPSWQRLDAEQQNVRAALAHALETGQGTTALRICGAVSWWWYRRGYVQEGRDRLAEALAAAPDAPPEVRVRALLGDALLAYLSGDVAAIWDRTHELIAIAPEDDATLALGLVLRGFVRALLGQGDSVQEAAEDTARGRAVAERCGVAWVQAEIAMTLGQFARAAGDPDTALAHLAESEQLALDLGHTWAWSSAQWIRAKVHVDTGRGGPALAALSAMVRQTESEGDATGTLAGLLTAVGAATCAGRPREAAVLLGAVEVVGRRVGYDPLRMDPVDGAGYVQAARDALPGPEHDRALAQGRQLDMAGACALVHRLADRAETRPHHVTLLGGGRDDRPTTGLSALQG